METKEKLFCPTFIIWFRKLFVYILDDIHMFPNIPDSINECEKKTYNITVLECIYILIDKITFSCNTFLSKKFLCFFNDFSLCNTWYFCICFKTWSNWNSLIYILCIDSFLCEEYWKLHFFKSCSGFKGINILLIQILKQVEETIAKYICFELNGKKYFSFKQICLSLSQSIHSERSEKWHLNVWDKICSSLIRAWIEQPVFLSPLI